MSTILLTHEFAPFHGGAATYVAEIAAAATRIGLAVEVWAPDRGVRSEESEEFPVVRLKSSGRLSLGGVTSFTWALRRQRHRLMDRPVVLLSAGAHMAWAALNLPTSNVTAFFHGSEIFRFERSRVWRGRMRRLYREVGGYGAASRYVSELERASSLADATKAIALAPCAVPRMLWELSSAEREASERFRVLTVARLHPRKGQVEMARALGRLSGALRERLIYQMVGTGEEWYRREIETACRGARVAFEFKGALDPSGLAAAYRDCDLYAQSSRTMARSVEGFGISYLEAGAFGRACVGVDTGGVGEAVLDGVTGLLAPEGDLGALAARIERLMADSELRAKLGEGGRRHAASFNWETSAAILVGRVPPRPTAGQRPPG